MRIGYATNLIRVVSGSSLQPFPVLRSPFDDVRTRYSSGDSIKVVRQKPCDFLLFTSSSVCGIHL